MRLCTEFVANFEAKMNQLRFVQILCAVGKTCSGAGWRVYFVGQNLAVVWLYVLLSHEIPGLGLQPRGWS